MIELEQNRSLPRIKMSAAPSLSFSECSSLMKNSDPWLTLGYTDSQLRAIAENSRDWENVKAILQHKTIAFTSFKYGFMRGAYMSLLAVDPEFRHTGVGSALMDHVEDVIFSRTRNIFLCVPSFNSGAQ